MTLTLGALLLNIQLLAQDDKVEVAPYKEIEVSESVFGDDLEMLGREREEYARHLTALALNLVNEKKGSVESMTEARKFIGVALHLSPRNKGAVVTNVQLGKGILPEEKKSGFADKILSSLLFARANVLKGIEGESNKLLAQVFTQIAADLNPLNEDAVFDAAMMEKDIGELPWQLFTGK